MRKTRVTYAGRKVDHLAHTGSVGSLDRSTLAADRCTEALHRPAVVDTGREPDLLAGTRSAAAGGPPAMCGGITPG